MKCPIDNATLQMTTREGVEIDYCPECRGVWLDRGELDKIIDRSGSQSQSNQSQHQQYPQQSHQDSHHNHHSDYEYNKKHKKESFLGDLFDF